MQFPPKRKDNTTCSKKKLIERHGWVLASLTLISPRPCWSPLLVGACMCNPPVQCNVATHRCTPSRVKRWHGLHVPTRTSKPPTYIHARTTLPLRKLTTWWPASDHDACLHDAILFFSNEMHATHLLSARLPLGRIEWRVFCLRDTTKWCFCVQHTSHFDLVLWTPQKCGFVWNTPSPLN